MKTDEEVTSLILDAWDELAAEEEGTPPEASVAAPDPAGEPEGEEAEETEEEESEERDQEETEEEVEEEESEEEEVAAEAPQFEDVEIQAFIAKYGGDVEKALKGAAELQRLMGRHGDERDGLTQQVEQLRAQLAQQQAFGGRTGPLNEEQQVWVEGAAESANPAFFVQQAIEAGEFDLARAVCSEWAQTNPFEAGRVGNIVDAVEYQSQQPPPPVEVPPATTWQALSQNYPELLSFETQMVETMQRLGPEHPSVVEARSTDPNLAVRGLMHIFDVAKASTFALSETKNGLRKQRREQADAAVAEAAVTSAESTPSSGGTPRQRRLMPGLSQEEFDSAFDAEFARQ